MGRRGTMRAQLVNSGSSPHIDSGTGEGVAMDGRWVVDDRLDAIYARAAQRLGDRALSARERGLRSPSAADAQAPVTSSPAERPVPPRLRLASSSRQARAGR